MATLYVFVVTCFFFHTVMGQSLPQVHGHRGTRYWMPENSVEAFQEAIHLNANWLELDVVCTKDQQLVVNHDPYFKKSLFSEAPALNILQLDLSECKKATWGLKDQKKYPYQKKVKTHIRTLEETIQTVEEYCQQKGLPLPSWNIEIKSLPHKKRWYPDRTIYAQIVLQKVQALPIKGRYFIQSFDAKLLKEIHQQDSTVPLYYLVIRPGKVKNRIRKLGFKPLGINPYYRFLDGEFVKQAHEQGLKVIPWTVNNPYSILRMRDIQVDGIISDVPDWVHFLLTHEPSAYHTLSNPLAFSEEFLQTVQNQNPPNLFLLKCYMVKNLDFQDVNQRTLFYRNLFQAFETLLKERNPASMAKKSFYKRKIIGFQGQYIRLRTLQKWAMPKQSH